MSKWLERRPVISAFGMQKMRQNLRPIEVARVAHQGLMGMPETLNSRQTGRLGGFGAL